MTDETKDKPEWPRINKLDAPDGSTLSGHDFALYRLRVFRALKADSLEHKVERQQAEYEAADAEREKRRQEREAKKLEDDLRS
jgi:hypothetical protein